MTINYSDQKVIKGSKSIFLAGPTPRDQDVKSWRPEAINILNSLNYDGVIYVPEHEFEQKYGYIDQVSWEREALTSADVILFWVPREIKIMPAFTTNTEFGYFIAKNPETVVYGRPDEAPKNKYQDWLYKHETGKEPLKTLENTLQEAVELTNELSKKEYNKDTSDIFFTADTHFGSERILQLSKRPFGSTKQMDITMINNWNEKVNDNSQVFHLGDFGNYENIKHLKGQVTLMLGNYELQDIKDNWHGDVDKFRAHLISLGFRDVVEEGKTITVKELEEPIYLAHQPIHCKKEIFNLFGHIHKLSMVKEFGLNIGVDGHNFKPLDVNEVAFYKTAIENFYDIDVFSTKNDIENETYKYHSK